MGRLPSYPDNGHNPLSNNPPLPPLISLNHEQ